MNTTKSKAKAKAKKATTSNGRLRPGELDGLVLGYMQTHKNELPLTATAIGKGHRPLWRRDRQLSRPAGESGGSPPGRTQTTGYDQGKAK